MKDSLYKIPKYSSICQTRGNGERGGGVEIIHDSLTYNTRPDLCINNDNIEAICIKIVNKKGKNIFINTHYIFEIYFESEEYFKDFLNKTKNNAKDIYIVGDLNLNLFDFSMNSKVKNYLNIAFQNFFIPMINKPT